MCHFMLSGGGTVMPTVLHLTYNSTGRTRNMSEIPRNYQGQLHAWMRYHRAHGHDPAPGRWEQQQLACDEELAYAIDADEYETKPARDLMVGDVIRNGEHPMMVIYSLDPSSLGCTPDHVHPGEPHRWLIGTDKGLIMAYPGRLLEVFGWAEEI